MTEQQIKSNITALLREKKAYEIANKDDRTEQVDKEIIRLETMLNPAHGKKTTIKKAIEKRKVRQNSSK